MASKNKNRVSLNKTRSSKERWNLVLDRGTIETNSGKDVWLVSDFASSDHTMKDEVLNWVREAGHGDLIPAATEPVVIDAPVVVEKKPNGEVVPSDPTPANDEQREQLYQLWIDITNR